MKKLSLHTLNFWAGTTAATILNLQCFAKELSWRQVSWWLMS